MKKYLLIKLFILLIIFINSHLCICQSDIQEIINLPASDFVDIKFANNNLGYFLIDNKLFATTDLGDNFTLIYVYSEEDRFDNLFISNDIIALITTHGYGDVYTISTNGGINWNVNDSINKHSLQLLRSNLIYGTNNTFGVEKSSILYYSSNLGLKWNVRYKFKEDKKQIDTLCKENMLYFVNDSVGFYYGRYNVESAKGHFEPTDKSEVFILRTTNRGYNWINLNSLSKYRELNGIQFLDNNNGFVNCGKFNKFDKYDEFLLKTTDGGYSWEEFITNYKPISDVKFITPKDGFVWGYNCPLFMTNDGGRSFRPVNIPISYRKNIECLSDGTTFAVNDKKIFRFNIYSNSITDTNIISEYEKRYSIQRIESEAENLFNSKEYLQALNAYNELFELTEFTNPLDYQLYFNAAYCNHELKRYSEALVFYEKAVKLNAAVSAIFYNMGLIYEELSNIEQAKIYYNKALLIDSEFTSATKRLNKLNDNIVFPFYKAAFDIYMELSYDSYYSYGDKYNIDFKKVYKAIEYCQKGLEYKSNYDYQLESILNMMKTLIKTKETFPEAYPDKNGKLRENYDNSMNIYYEKDTSGVTNANMISDSLLKPLNENEVGLLVRFPPNWKLMDSRQININQKEFTGVLLLDTAVKNKEAALTMNIQLDPKGEYWNQFTFKNVFEEDSLHTIYSLEPKSEANQTYYRFYLASKTDNVFISAFIESTYFEKYKPEIERIVRSIRIQRNQKPLW